VLQTQSTNIEQYRLHSSDDHSVGQRYLDSALSFEDELAVEWVCEFCSLVSFDDIILYQVSASFFFC
jgi:hypothetical protein